ncbi:hypothetical protein K443DRAFT_106891, partial [Laccaria amethystina LaAM-08-1]
RREACAEGTQDHPCNPHLSSSALVGPSPPTTYDTQPALVRKVARGARRNVRDADDG